MNPIQVSGRLVERLDPELLERGRAILPRLAAGDPTLWGSDAEAEARVRLGWLALPETSRALLDPLASLAAAMRAQGRTRVVLCGMGGSSLAPEVIALNAGATLVVLDSTDPEQVNRASTELDRTVVVLASKSGSTIETDSHRRHFISALRAAGLDPRDHIVVVTDPDSPFDDASQADGYRVIHADPHVGGRFSALSAFGLTPTALLGIDPSVLLDQAAAAQARMLDEDSPALLLGVAMAQQEQQGPLMSIAATDRSLAGLGDWVEQLVAESTGKESKGILPVVVESTAATDFLGSDRLAVSLGPNPAADLAVQAPLGAQFLLWEWATAIAGHLIGIDPFNQPNVTESKTNTGTLLQEWGGAAPTMRPDGVDGPVEVYGATTIAEGLERLEQAGYVAIMAYLDRGADAQVARLRETLAVRYPRSGITFGWGPRFLHSTGQFHKGGPQTGAFLQITGACAADVEIPGRDYGFATLQLAQALGDVRALTSRGRPVVRFHLRDRRAGIAHLLSVAFSS